MEGRCANSIAFRPRSRDLFRKRVGGKKLVVAVKPEQAAVQFVGAGLSHVLGHQPGYLAQLRVVVTRRDLHFLDGILIRRDDLHARQAKFYVGNAVNLIFVGPPELPVGYDGGS